MSQVKTTKLECTSCCGRPLQSVTPQQSKLEARCGRPPAELQADYVSCQSGAADLHRGAANLVAERWMAAMLCADVLCVIQGVAYAGDDFDACKAYPMTPEEPTL